MTLRTKSIMGIANTNSKIENEMVDFNTPRMEQIANRYPNKRAPESPKNIFAGWKLNFKNMPVEPIIEHNKYEIISGETDNDTKNKIMDVKHEIPTANPSIPSIMLNILIITIVHMWVIKNETAGAKNIGCESDGHVINSIRMWW